jgi:hypothetical protein
MKSWHLGIVVAIIVGYAIGVIWPAWGVALKAKLGA